MSGRCAPGRCAPGRRAPSAPRRSQADRAPLPSRPPLPRWRCLTRSVTTGSSSWLTSTASCTPWCAGAGGCAGSLSARPPTRRTPCGSPGRRCAGWRTGLPYQPTTRRCTPGWRRWASGSTGSCSATAGGHLGSGSVVIVPPGRLQAVPWGLLPRLRSRAVSVAPSATSWLRARQADDEPARARGRAAQRARRARPGTGLASAGPRCRCSLRTTAPTSARDDARRSPCSAAAPRRPGGCLTRSTGRGSRTSRRTGPFARTARCSPRCGSTTGRSPCTTWSGCAAGRAG